jgi:outer membrane translocation and assembly module TamA
MPEMHLFKKMHLFDDKGGFMRWKKRSPFLTFGLVLIFAFSYQILAQDDVKQNGETEKSVLRDESNLPSQGTLKAAESQSEASQTQGAEPSVHESSMPEEESDKYPDPNLIPYRTKKSALVHFFSLPAKIWHLIWAPFGSTVVWIEQNRIPDKVLNVFLNDDRTGGFFPLISLGGNTGAAAGITVFHNNLFNKRKKVNFSFLFNTEDNNTTTLTYSDSSLIGSSFYFDFLGNYFNDSDENLFISESLSPENLANSSIRGNETVEDDETSYSTRQGGFLVNIGYARNRRIGWGITGSFKRADIDSGDGRGGDKFPRAVPGFGTTSLFSIGTTLTFNFRNGWPRTLSGTLIQFSFQYNRELNGSRFEYNRYTVEAHQFIPIPFLAKNRRLGVRVRFEKLDRLSGKQIPFYELSLLGDAATLRGFDRNRFRGRGSLLFNFEYRYPVWDTWDAVIFFDEGQVFDDLGDLNIDDFQWAVGTGLRVMTATGFVFRFEVGFSREKVRGLFQITPNF